MKVERAAQLLEALGHVARLRIFRLLARAGAKGMPVGSVAERLQIPGSTLSHHLRKLGGAGLVWQERRGTVLVCRADMEAAGDLAAWLAETPAPPVV